MRKFLLLVLTLFLFSKICYAQTIIALKSGKTVEGTLIERNDQYIKINFSDVDITYWLDEVESIQLPDGTKISPSAKVQSQDLPLVSQTVTTAPSEQTPAYSNTTSESTRPFPQEFKNTSEKDVPSGSPHSSFPVKWVLQVLLLIVHALFFQKIAQKLNTPKAWLAWVPIGNLILMCDMAEKPRWWAALFLLILIPFVGVIAILIIYSIMMIKICQRRERPWWWGIATMMPLVNFIILSYLAFVDKPKENIVPYEPKGEDTTHENLA